MLPSPQPVATLLFVLVFSGSVLLGDHAYASLLAVDLAALQRGEQLWSPLGAMWMAPEPAVGSGALAASLLVFWLFGSALESFWGAWRFALYVVGVSLLGWILGLAICLLWLPSTSDPVRSALALHVVVLVGFGVVFRQRSLSPLGLTQLPGWAAALIAGVALLSIEVGAGSPTPVFVAAALAGALALLVAHAPWRRGQASTIPARKKPMPSHLKLVYSAEDLLN